MENQEEQGNNETQNSVEAGKNTRGITRKNRNIGMKSEGNKDN